MKILNCYKIPYQVLRAFYKLAPFNIKGALVDNKNPYQKDHVSCLIVSNKPSLLNNLLEDLKAQDLPKDKFEVVVVFDGRSTDILNLIHEYKQCLNIVLHQPHQPVRVLSDLRNISVSLSKGEFLLFLDDDTRIYQKNFLRCALTAFNESRCDVLIPQANALFGIVRGRYDFLDRFSFTNRCSFYRKKVIQGLGGFMKGLHTYEDTEMSIRLMLNKPKVIHDEELNYYHPPLYFDSMRKPLAIGQSIFQICRHYSMPVWLLVYFNALRFLPCGLLPGERYRHWFKISLGVLLYPFTGKSYYY